MRSEPRKSEWDWLDRRLGTIQSHHRWGKRTDISFYSRFLNVSYPSYFKGKLHITHFSDVYQGGAGDRHAVVRPKDQLEWSKEQFENSSVNKDVYSGGKGERYGMARPKDQLERSTDPLDGTSVSR